MLEVETYRATAAWHEDDIFVYLLLIYSDNGYMGVSSSLQGKQ